MKFLDSTLKEPLLLALLLHALLHTPKTKLLSAFEHFGERKLEDHGW